jgi:hypothetical protein
VLTTIFSRLVQKQHDVASAAGMNSPANTDASSGQDFDVFDY